MPNTYTVTLDAAATTSVTVNWQQSGNGSLSSVSTVIAPTARSSSVSATWSTPGTGSIDFSVSPSLTRSGRPISVAVVAAGSAPLALGFDAATPHQISINAVHTRTLAAGATARVDYRVTGAPSWIDGGYLYRTRTANGAAADAFAGWVVDLQPGTTYDVRLEVIESGVTTYSQGTRATRSLPAEGTAQTKSANTGNFGSVMAGAVAGDVIVLAAGTYTLSGFGWTSPGTSGSPVVIRGAGIDSTILSDSTGVVLSLSGSYFTFEDMTVRGSQSDAGAIPSSTGVVLTTGIPTNATFRRIKFDGVDIGVMRDGQVNGLLIYDCNFVGNNPWSSTLTPITRGYPLDTWNDTGVRAPGFGNCVWNCTFVGFGDTIKLGHSGGWGGARACYIYRNWVKYGGDDGCEFDESDGNCAFYDNRIANTAMGASFDGIDSGPVGLFRNVFVNQTRAPMKFTSAARGARIYNNTWVGTTRTSSPNWDYGMYAASGSLYDFDFRNNLLIYRGAGALISFNQSLYGSTLTDYNAWYPDGRSIYFGSGSGSYTGLTAAKAGLAPRMAHDVIVASDPFASPITLGADYTVQYIGYLDARLAGVSSARNSGVAIAGVTDGYTGAAPNMGADISGRAAPAIGAPSNPYRPE
ncbi:MAG: hypothetical protein F9K36_15960 [Burkholderiaceae bacterium]|nr:MAG: hypothetical protein F9K36_15960 [Burkholderiaceae bacterium]